MTEVITSLVNNGLLVSEQVNTFRCLLVAKPDSSARFIVDIYIYHHGRNSTCFHPPRYTTQQRKFSLLSRQQIPSSGYLKSGFFQIPIARDHRRYYGITYAGHSYALTRLLMGHPLAPSILQRVSSKVAAYLHAGHGVCTVAHPDDWLLFAPSVAVHDILQDLHSLGFTINTQNSILTPNKRLAYLGLDIHVRQHTIRPTSSCLQHL